MSDTPGYSDASMDETYLDFFPVEDMRKVQRKKRGKLFVILARL